MSKQLETIKLEELDPLYAELMASVILQKFPKRVLISLILQLNDRQLPEKTLIERCQELQHVTDLTDDEFNELQQDDLISKIKAKNPDA